MSHDSEPVYKLEFVDIPAKQLMIQWPCWIRDGNWRRASGIGQEITALEIGAWAVGLTSCWWHGYEVLEYRALFFAGRLRPR